MAETQVGTLRVDVKANVDNFKAGLKKIGDDLSRSKLLFAAATASIAAVGLASLKAAGQMEQWRISFTTMLGSAEKAGVLLEMIKEFAKETPFELPDVVKGAKNLLAFGIEGDKLLPTLKSLGDVSAGLGVPMERLILNFGQIKSQAKLTGRELRDFAIAGVPLLSELAKNLNITEKEVQDMVSAGKIGFEEVDKAFKTMSGEGGKFANLMKNQMKSLFGIWSNLKDAIIQAAIAVGDILIPITKDLVMWLIKLVDMFMKAPKSTKVFVVVLAGIAAMFTGILASLGGIVALWPVIKAALAVVTGKIALLSAALIAIPALIFAIKTNFLGFNNIAVDVFNNILDIVVDTLNNIKKIWSDSSSSWLEDFQIVYEAITEYFSTFTEDVEVVFDFVQEKMDAFGDGVNEWLDDLKTVVSFVSGSTVETVQNVAGKVKSTVNVAGESSKKAIMATKVAILQLKNNAVQQFDEVGKKFSATADASILKGEETKNKHVSFSQQLKTALHKDIDSWREFFISGIVRMRDVFASGMADMIVNGGSFKDAFKKIGQTMLKFFIEEIIKRMVTKWIAAMATMRAASSFLGVGIVGGVAALALGGGFKKMFASGGIVREPSIMTGMRTGKQAIVGESGPEAFVSLKNDLGLSAEEGRNRLLSPDGGMDGGGGGQITVNITGQFLEGSEAKWQRLVRESIVPEIRRFTDYSPIGPFQRRRGQST